MASLKTPADLGNVILQRRKALGWDQARLAHEAGVSRQWIIEIEKGKPRAELQLVLRTLNVLGIELNTSTYNLSPPVASGQALDLPDVDRIIEYSRTSRNYPSGSRLDAVLNPSLVLAAYRGKSHAQLKSPPAPATVQEQQGKFDALQPSESGTKPGSPRKGKK